MEMGMRDWMIVISVLLFLLVVLDGLRRAQRERKKQVRMSRKAEKLRFDGDDAVSLSELPNGGNKRLAEQRSFARQDEADSDPLFTNPFERDSNQDTEVDESLLAVEVDTELDGLVAEGQADDCEPLETELSALDPENENVVEDIAAAKKAAATDMTEQKFYDDSSLSKDGMEEQLVIYVVPQAGIEGFEQADIIHILEECDLRLSPASVFERFEQEDGQGAVQFRVANASKTGRFVVGSDGQKLKGVTLFLRLPGPEKPIEAFEDMIAVARCIADNLQGALQDELHSTMTEQTLQHNRQRIKDYLQQRLVKHG